MESPSESNSLVLLNKDIQLFYGLFADNFCFTPVLPTLVYCKDTLVNVRSGNESVSSHLVYLSVGQEVLVECASSNLLLIHHGPFNSFKFCSDQVDQPLGKLASGNAIDDIVHELVVELADSLMDFTLRDIDPDESFEFVEAYRLGLPQSKPKDPRMMELASELFETSDQVIPIPRFFEAYGLSKSRFSFLFKREFGVSATTVRLWMRLCKCVLRYSYQPDAALCAVESGFADYSQYSRVFKKMIGKNPCRFKHTRVLWAAEPGLRKRKANELSTFMGRELAS